MKEAWLRCAITPGQFSGEYAIESTTHKGDGFSLFAWEHDLQSPTRPFPQSGGRVDGWIRVRVVKALGGRALVQLPQSTMDNGDTVTVDASSLKMEAGCPETVP